MKEGPLMKIKEKSQENKLEEYLKRNIDNINVLYADNDYSGVVRNLANAIIHANDLLDIQATKSYEEVAKGRR